MQLKDFALVGGTALVMLVGFVGFLFAKRKLLKTAASANHLATSLRDERVKSEIVLNAIDDGVILFDKQNVIQHFNPGASKVTGWPSEEAIGLDYHNVIKLVDAKGQAIIEEADPFQRFLREGKAVRENTLILMTRSNKQIYISLTISPLLAPDNTVEAGIAIFRDISEEHAEQAQRAEFISTASHEMRTPVAAIEGYLSLALNDKVSTIDSRARDYLEKAHASTQHLGQLFQDLLTSAKAEDGRLSNHPGVVEMGSFLQQLSEDLKFAAEKKGLFVDFVIGSTTNIDASAGADRVVKPLYYVYADADRLREVITNLFDNAVKYTDEGKVSLGLTGDKATVQCYVKDTGAGIPAEDIPHLFQKFYRVDSSATRTIGGTGLGLFICRKIIELYQGRIWVESTVGEGSTFYINLPRLDNHRADELGAAQEVTPLPALSNPTGL